MQEGSIPINAIAKLFVSICVGFFLAERVQFGFTTQGDLKELSKDDPNHER